MAIALVLVALVKQQLVFQLENDRYDVHPKRNIPRFDSS